MNAGEKLERGELKITAVYPDASASPKDRNGHSLRTFGAIPSFYNALNRRCGTDGRRRSVA